LADSDWPFDIYKPYSVISGSRQSNQILHHNPLKRKHRKKKNRSQIQIYVFHWTDTQMCVGILYIAVNSNSVLWKSQQPAACSWGS